MRIAELTPPPPHHHYHHHTSTPPSTASPHLASLISHLDSLIIQSSQHSPLPPSLPSDLRHCVTRLSQLAQLGPFPNPTKLQIWSLCFRLWNSCVDYSNSKSKSKSDSEAVDDGHAEMRHVAADLLWIVADVEGVPAPELKTASFYHRTGLIWHEKKGFAKAIECFERATSLISKMETESRGNEVDRETRKLLFEVNVARARTAWDTKELNVAIALLNRCKKGTEDSATRYLSLANQYLLFGKSLCRSRDKNEEEKRSGDGGNDDGEALRMMNEALELCERGLRVVKRREEAVSLKELRDKTLRFVAAVNLNKEEFESVIKCVRVLRENSCDQHPSLSVLAMKAWLGLGRFGEAEKELRGMVVENGIPEGIWVTAVEAYFKKVGVAGVETVRSVFMGLLGRCSVSAAAAIRVVCKVVGDGGNDAGGDGEKVRAALAAELAVDERVVALFVGDRRGKERTNMHAVLWNYAAAYFKTKDYKISAELFEKAMLYVPSGMESRILPAKGFRVLSLCHLGLSQLDQVQEYIDEAEKLEPNIACAFLKFKIFLQNNNHDAAISQVQAMMSCTNFTTDFLSLAAHEAVACAANPVAVAALSNLLNFYSSGKMMPISEVVVLRTIVTILLQKPDNEQDALIFMKKAQARMAELGPDKFFGKKEVGRRERSWFATTAWNNGTRTGEAKIYDLCTEYFMLASDFYGVVMEGEVEGNDPMVCKSIILSVSPMIAAEKQNKVTFVDAEVKHAMR